MGGFLSRKAQPAPVEAQSGPPTVLKLLITGDAGVGKTSFVRRSAGEGYSDVYMTTIGVDFLVLRRNLGEAEEVETTKIQMWDSAGSERFKFCTSYYYRAAHGIFIAYDVSRRDSFENVPFRVTEVKRNAKANCILVLLALKADVKEGREVTEEEGRALADFSGALYQEASSKEGRGVEEAVMALSRSCVRVFAMPQAGASCSFRS